MKKIVPMAIRKATKQDLHPLALLFDKYRVFYRKESAIEAAKAFLEDRIELKDAVIYVDELENGDLTGFAQLYPIFSSTRMKRLWLLNDLFVAPKYRGRGISKRLLEQAKILVQETNACGFFLETEKSNTIGNQLYPAVGMSLNEMNNYYYWDK